jgi:eukaryotic-like serine/threonine-protein kinase
MADPKPPARPGHTMADPAPQSGGSAEAAAPALERYRLLDWARFRAAGASDSAADPEAAVIGAGAMGRVLLALDERMGRVVAIKETHPGEPGQPRPQGRFLREARVTGALEHPGIVPVHEIGERADGAAYYTMRLVRGRSLAAAIEAADGLRARLALLPHVVDLCHAIAFAHSQGVIHRDLKPENVMVGEFGETVVLDWGLASGLAADPVVGAAPSRASLAGATSPSRTAGVMGTPAFMSPEQAWGRPGEVDEATDVWALGAVLYNLLTGTLPVPGRSAQANLDWLRDDRKQVQPVRECCPEAPPELASVAMACLVRDVARRCASAQQLARDLERWQAGERVVAHRYSAWELATHIVNRNRPLSVAVAVAAVVAAAAVGFSITTWQARQEAEVLSRQHAFEQLLLAREALEGQRPLEAQARLRASLEAHDSLLGRALWARIQATPLMMRQKLESEVTGLAFCPDGELITVASASPDLTLIDPWTGEREVREGPGRDLYVVAWSPDGSWLAAGTGGGGVALWDERGSPDPHLLVGHEDIVSALAFDRKGERLVSGSFDGTARLWDLATRTGLQVFEGHDGPITATAWSPWEDSVATASADETVRIWDADSGALRHTLEGHQGEVTGLAWLEGGGVLVSAGYDGTLRSWDAKTGQQLSVRSDPSAHYTILAGAGRGGTLAAADDSGRLHLWSPPSAERASVLEGGRSIIFALALNYEGDRIASGGIDRSMSLWNTASAGVASPSPGHEGPVAAVDVFPDGLRLASAGWDGTVRTWDRANGGELAAWTAHDDTVESLRIAPDGASLATGGADRSVRIHDAATGDLLRLLTGHYGAVIDLAWSPDSGRLASAGDQGMVYLWDLATGERQTVLDQRSPTAVAFGPAGERLALAWSEGELAKLRVVALPGLEPVFEVEVSGIELVRLDLSSDGQGVHGISREGQVLSWDLAGGVAAERAQLSGRGRAIRADASGRWLAASSTTPELRILGVGGGVELTLDGHREPVAGLSFDPAGTVLASAGYDGTVRAWDPGTGRALWRSTGLLPSQGLRHGFGGWRAIDGADVSLPDVSWARAVDERARLVSESSGGQRVCLQDWDGRLELWDLAGDTLLAAASAEPAVDLAAVGQGCAALGASGSVLFLGDDGTPARRLELDSAADVLRAAGDRLLIGSNRTVELRGPAAEKIEHVYVPLYEPTAVGGDWQQLSAGDDEGAVQISHPQPDGSWRSVWLRETPSSATTQLATGPAGTVAAGFADGTVGLWDPADGTRLITRRLHGAVTHLAARDGHLHVLTELGAYLAIDLSVLEAERCEVMRQVWFHAPVCEGPAGLVFCTPDAPHPCYEAAVQAAPASVPR